MKYEESAIQQVCVQWFRLRYPKLAHVLVHVPNEGKRMVKMVRTATGYRQVCTGAAKLKAEGMVPGVADLLLLVPRGGFGCLAIEMKSKKGVVRDTQKEWAEKCKAAGNMYAICRSVDEFMEIVDNYLALDGKTPENQRK